MLRNPFRRRRPTAPQPSAPTPTTSPAEPDSHALAALDHVAAWVRFADGKATLLAAGLAATLTLLGGRLDTITAALSEPCPHPTIVAIVGGLTLLAALWTLGWLVGAITPRKTVTHPGLNRFGWPVMATTTLEEIEAHVAANSADRDAWKQEIDLAKIAKTKFGCMKMAAHGFAVTLALGVGLVAYTAVITA